MSQTVFPLVLIIEDERPIRRFLDAALTSEGYRIVEAETGEEGLKRALQQPPDMVILDLGLPDMEGGMKTKRTPDLQFVSANQAVPQNLVQRIEETTDLQRGIRNTPSARIAASCAAC
ncbi:MAG: response regulator [Planctomycetaceae bacterium]